MMNSFTSFYILYDDFNFDQDIIIGCAGWYLHFERHSFLGKLVVLSRVVWLQP